MAEELTVFEARTWEHRRNMRLLEAEYIDSPRSLAGVVAALVAILGILVDRKKRQHLWTNQIKS